jgi:NADH-quinone oxidoreductase subunit N
MIETASIDWAAILPDLVLLGGAFLLLMLISFVRGRDRGISLVVGIGAFGLSAALAIGAWNADPVVTLGDALQIDRVAQAVRVLVAACGILTLLLALGWNRMREAGGEFTALLLLVGVGMNLLVEANSFVTLFVALELFSISLYVLCAYDGRSRASLESGFKYLILGTLGSVVLLYGAAFLYGATGSFAFAEVHAGLQDGAADGSLAILGTVLVLAGLAFKIGVMPFHMWVPDVYEGAPTPVTAFMAAATKIAAFVILARVLVDALPTMRDTWEPMLLALAVLTIIAGNVAALVQENLKRMLAYASVGAAGFGLIAVVAGGDDGTRALVFYLAAFAPMAIGAFAVIALHERDLGGRPATLASIRAWGFDRPLAGVAMVVFLLGLAGFPPTVGFVAKVVVLGAALDAGLAWLAVVGVLGSVIMLGYVLRVILALFDRSARSGVLRPAASGLASTSAVIAICLVVVLAVGILPGLGLDWAREAAFALTLGR